MLRLMKAVYLCLCMLAAFCFPAAALPADCSQVIVGSADGWNSSHVQLSLLVGEGPVSGASGKIRSGLGQGRQPPSHRRAGEEGGGLALSRGNF